jgi:hypothetical protein
MKQRPAIRTGRCHLETSVGGLFAGHWWHLKRIYEAEKIYLTTSHSCPPKSLELANDSVISASAVWPMRGLCCASPQYTLATTFAARIVL